MNPGAQNPVSPHVPLALHALHERSFADNRFVYPVLSRRSGGLSIGVNLNPDKVCNFDCIYCQVDRREQSETRFVAMPALLAELDAMLGLVAGGRIYETEKFRATPEPLRRLNDIAFSGDGEPTTYRNFDEIIAACAELKRRHGLDAVKMVLISNASMFHRPHVRRGLEILDANQGEIWAKLEWGTEAYYQLVERTPIPMRRILDNITAAARVRPLVIQSLFMRIQGEPPPAEEQAAYCERLQEIVAAGGHIKLVQIYTVARRPAEDFVAPLTDNEVDALVALVRERTQLPTAAFYGQEEGATGESGRGEG
ncbi:MAG TPA: radical SAM protein [Pirellulales bacterium]|jgi:wyosine [tRNA(Phe)-imidazoG37] synthetase (radical SAM superfamily)|nr:radical SAM protein [Pirellulales bacterium]